MIKSAAFLLIITLRIFYHAASTADVTAFAEPRPAPVAVAPFPAHVISFNGSVINKKITLNWVIDKNETAYQFEVEKSTGGKGFKLAAIVFGTDKNARGSYEFYEKAGNQKVSYRIKIVNKNQEIVYSPVVDIDPGK